MKIVVTGAAGFVGSAVVSRLLLNSDAESIISIARHEQKARGDKRVVNILVEDIGKNSDWTELFLEKNMVVHCAARVHVMNDTVADPLAEFRRVNVEGTLNLARQAAAAGVTRFVFVSSIKVNGESTSRRLPYTADDIPAPLDAYGISKQEAEEGLRAIALQTGMEVVIIRPPLIYGPGVKANFASMIRWIRRGVPLPLGAIDNRRSFVGLDNLVDLIHVCLTHPAAANQTFLVSDGEDVSTTQLLRRMAKATNSHSWLVPVPSKLLVSVATLMGKADVASRLCGSLQVDIQKTRDLLGWTPPVSFDAGLKKTAEASA